MKIKSFPEPIALKDIVDKHYFFNIPIYQRLYVWQITQVKTLLEDMLQTFENPNKDIFHIGGVLVVENKSQPDFELFDLIDGQQRFTTLWMISMVFRDELAEFIDADSAGKGAMRIQFAIRDEIDSFFKSYMADGICDDSVENTENIVIALKFIEGFKSQLEKKSKRKLKEFSEFIFQSVRMIFTQVPSKTDLNKLFEIINNRGIQLQHHEILKAKLLNSINSKEKDSYATLWNACSQMDDYIEKSLSISTGRTLSNIATLFENGDANKGIEIISKPQEVIKFLNAQESKEINARNLSEILLTDRGIGEDINKDNSTEDKSKEVGERVQSIISFSMLLQHTLRIYLFRIGKSDIGKISDKELISIFNNNFLSLDGDKEEHVKEFISLLWQVRYYFDKHVIKWVFNEEGKCHVIHKLYKSTNGKTNSLQRNQPVEQSLSLLQSMLYHSQEMITQYWLTPFLGYLLNEDFKNAEMLLKHFDNQMNCTVDSSLIIERSYKLLKDPLTSRPYDISALEKKYGVRFSHYWFYKLEYILWDLLHLEQDEKWQTFRVTARNSVEHISPQTRKEEDINTVDKMLDAFGNLALVSGSVNSEYGNNTFKVKKEKFKEKLKVDSLKMDLIFNSPIWNDNVASDHQAKMITLFNEYLDKISTEVSVLKGS